jgi:hypothetical protein
MNNATLHSADRKTHLKVVVVSLLAGIIVIGIGLAARQDLGAPSLGFDGKLQATGPVIKAGQPVTWSGRESATIR